MKISIRPAPHSKGCAFAGRTWCSKFDNQAERCDTECPAGYCCEMKHCWDVGEKLRDILVARGHEVMMANKKYRKGVPESKASENSRLAMAELMAWNPDVHVAIHTNSASKSVTGVRIGYPDYKYNSDEYPRVQSSKRLADQVVEFNKEIYHTPSKVKACTYNFYELNKPTCPAIYIEGCFANSNEKDAKWWHENPDAIAKSYADGLEAWWLAEGNSLPNGTKPAPTPVATTALINTKGSAGLSLWDSYKKQRAMISVKKDEVVNVLSMTPVNNFYYCEYKGVKGYADGKYLLFENKEDSNKEEMESTPPTTSESQKYAIINTKFAAGLSLWDGYQKDKALVKVKKGEMVKILSMTADHGFYHCEYNGVKGYADGQYLKFVDEAACGYAQVKSNYTGTLNVWTDTKKTKSLCVISKNTTITLLSNTKTSGYYRCSYNGHEGYVNAKYIQMM